MELASPRCSSSSVARYDDALRKLLTFDILLYCKAQYYYCVWWTLSSDSRPRYEFIFRGDYCLPVGTSIRSDNPWSLLSGFRCCVTPLVESRCNTCSMYMSVHHTMKPFLSWYNVFLIWLLFKCWPSNLCSVALEYVCLLSLHS